MRNFFIFAACLAGISVSAMEYSDTYDYMPVYDDDGSLRMEASDNSTADSSNDDSSDDAETVLSKGKVHFKTTQIYIHYRRGYRDYDSDSLPYIDPNKDTYLLIPGYFERKNSHSSVSTYQAEFTDTVGHAILYTCDCNVIGVRWYISINSYRTEHTARGAITVGRRLGKLFYDLAVKKGFKKPISVVSHHLGNVAATAFTDIVRRPVKYVYGLDQRPLPAPFRRYYLRQDSSYLVQTITTRGFKRNYGHRNFYPNGGNYSSYGSECFYCQSYRLFSDCLKNNGNNHQATFCSNYGAYVDNLCEYFPQVSYYSRTSPESLPYGNYFITEDYQ